MKSSTSTWYRITMLGSSPEFADSKNEAVYRSNQLAVILFSFSALFFSISFGNQEFTMAVSLLLSAFLFTTVFVFNALQLTQASRLLVSFAIIPVMAIPVFTFGKIASSNHQLWLYSVMAVSFLPLFVLDRKNEQGLIVLNLVFNFGFLLSANMLLTNAGVVILDNSDGISSSFFIVPQLNFYTISIGLYAFLGSRLLPNSESFRVIESKIEIGDNLNTGDFSKTIIVNSILSKLDALRVSSFVEDEKGFLRLEDQSNSVDGLPHLQTQFNFKLSNAYQEVLSKKWQVVFDCLNDTRTSGFYAGEPHSHVLASLEIPFYNGTATAGVIRCEIEANKASWSNSTLEEAKTLVEQYANELPINRKKEIQAKEQFEEQRKLILAQNKELSEQRVVLEEALKQQKQTQKELSKKEAEARGLLKTISDHNYVFEYNRKGDIIWLNEKSLDLFGMTLEEVRGKNWSEFDLSFIRDNELVNAIGQSFWRDLLKGKSIKRETKIDINNTETWVAATFLPIVDEKGRPIRILGIAQDITDIHTQQEKIKEQNELLVATQEEIIRINEDLEGRVKDRTKEIEKKNEQLVEYTYINAHMLRAPVCNILGLVELLENSEIKEENREVVNYLHKSAFELDDIVNKINETLRYGYKVDRSEWKTKANKAILATD